MSAPYTVPLGSEVTARELIGGKGFHLSRLVAAGLPVPAGWVLTTALPGFHRRQRPDGIHRRSDRRRPAQRPRRAGRALADDSRALRDRHGAGRCGGGINDLAAAFRVDNPAAPALAVRSSATAEDQAGASFAGQQETFLNVRGREALRAAVIGCWSSLWTDRAIAYRARRGIDPASVQLAIVVQPLIAADVAGVLFTANPTTRDVGEVVINSAWGLGEAIVAGAVTPDEIVADKATGAIRRQTPGDKAVRTVPAAAGTMEEAVPPANRRRLTLSPHQVAELVRLGQEIEALFGAPQDIEWAIADGRVIILQARPITAIAPPAPAAPDPADDWIADDRPRPSFNYWTQTDVGERWPEPVTPLTWSFGRAATEANFRYLFRDLREPYLDRIAWVRRSHGRVYLNEGAMRYVYLREYGIPLGAFGDATGTGLPGDGMDGNRFQPRRFLRRLPLFLKDSALRLRHEKEYAALFPTIDRWVAGFLAADRSRQTDADLFGDLTGVWLARLQAVTDRHAEVSGTAFAALPVFEGLVERWLGRQEAAAELIGGLSGVVAAEMTGALECLGAALRATGTAALVLNREPAAVLAALRRDPAAQPVLDRLTEFLARHGHRAAIEAELKSPRWQEAPDEVITLAAGYLRNDGSARSETRASQSRTSESAWEAVAGRLNPARRAVLRTLLDRVRYLIRLRDNGQNYLVRLLLPVRMLYSELGRRWAERGWLAGPDDIFFLLHDEIERVVRAGNPAAARLDPAALIADRRRSYRAWFDVAAPDALDSQGRPVAAPTAPAGDLAGVAASAGRATGPARIVPTLAEAGDLRTGDILVTRATDPGWTPLFGRIADLVLEVGGQLSHGAIVACEYGLPAVINLPGATRRIPAGARVTFYGTAGRVQIAADAAVGGPLPTPVAGSADR